MGAPEERPGDRSGTAAPVGPVGMVGLGVMGGAMAGHLLAAGFTVTGYDVAPERLEEHAARGGLAARSPRAAAAGAAIVLTSLPSAAALDEVVGGSDGLAAVADPDLVVVETSTLPIEVKERARAALAGSGPPCWTARSAAPARRPAPGIWWCWPAATPGRCAGRRRSSRRSAGPGTTSAPSATAPS